MIILSGLNGPAICTSGFLNSSLAAVVSRGPWVEDERLYRDSWDEAAAAANGWSLDVHTDGTWVEKGKPTDRWTK